MEVGQCDGQIKGALVARYIASACEPTRYEVYIVVSTVPLALFSSIAAGYADTEKA